MKILILFLLSLVPTAAQTQLSIITALRAVATPVMHVDTLALSTLAGGQPTTATLTLSATPIASMGAIIHFTSSQLGGDVFTAVPSIQSSIIFTLPTYSPFTPVDVITVVYWSTR